MLTQKEDYYKITGITESRFSATARDKKKKKQYNDW